MISGGIDYIEAGRGQPVVCLHGIGGGAASYSRQLSGLTDKRVIAWNMPGYGASPAPDGPWTFAGLSAALSGLLAELDLDRVHLVGHSIGGMLALEHSLRRPDQVASLTLIATTPRFGGRDDSFKKAFIKARLDPLDAGMTMAEIATSSAPGLVGSLAAPETIAEIARILVRVPQATWRGILQCLVTFDRKADLGKIAQPTCVIAGSLDQNAPAKTMQRMATAIAAARFHEINGAGHMINQEAPDQVNAIISEFLRNNPL